MKSRSALVLQQLAELREKLKTFEKFGYKASAKEVRRKIYALERGIDLDAPRVSTRDDRPRKTVRFARPLVAGRFRVVLSCGHYATVRGIPDHNGFKRAPHTAICPICNPK